jgi:hypothetical protein
VVLPTFAFGIAVWLIVVTLAARGLLSAATRLGVVDLEPHADRPLLVRWIDTKLRVDADREVLYEQVYFEGPDAPGRLVRFVLMMIFASIISAMGVLTDSTAVVIGAMLVAPLINPMMGMGLALTMGWPTDCGDPASPCCSVRASLSAWAGCSPVGSSWSSTRPPTRRSCPARRRPSAT